jgi:hypothetical protein
LTILRPRAEMPIERLVELDCLWTISSAALCGQSPGQSSVSEIFQLLSAALLAGHERGQSGLGSRTVRGGRRADELLRGVAEVSS